MSQELISLICSGLIDEIDDNKLEDLLSALASS